MLDSEFHFLSFHFSGSLEVWNTEYISIMFSSASYE